MCDPGRQHGSPRAIFTNWNEYDGPFSEKLRLTLRNVWVRLVHRQACCGNTGQPGC